MASIKRLWAQHEKVETVILTENMFSETKNRISNTLK